MAAFIASARLRALARLLHPSAWRFLALVATEPDLKYLYEHQRQSPRQRLRDPSPWLTRDANRYLAQHVRPGMRVLEWGAGASTLWFAARGCQVTSVEHDPSWIADLTARLPDNVQLVPRDLGDDYAAPPAALEAADIVLIDGRQRAACAATLAKRWSELPAGCLVILDDAQRAAYQDSRCTLRRLSSDCISLPGSFGVPLDKLTDVYIR